MAGVSASGGTPPYTYVWDDGQAQVTDIAFGLCDGTYCVTVHDNDGSSSVACVVVQNFSPQVTAAPTLPDMCMYEPPVLLTSGTPVGGIYSGSGVSESKFDPFVAGPGSHMITYTWYNVDSCYNEAITIVSVYAAPQVSLGPFPKLCVDDLPVSLNNGIPAGGTYSGPGVTGNTFDPSLTGVGSFLISYSYSDPSGCSADTSALIKVGSLPEAFEVSGGGISCPGVDPISVYLSNSEPGVSYILLQNGQPTSLGALGTGQSLVFYPLLDSGLYTVQAVNIETGCKAFMVGNASIQHVHMPVIEIGDTLHFCQDAGIKLDAGDFADSLTYEWFNGSTERFFTVPAPGLYWVKVMKGQCYTEDSVLVEACSELWMPNIFTPNGDAFNQRFLPKILAGEILEYSIEIYNRWGKMVYNSDDINEGWDGALFNRGNDCPEGVYFYVVRYTGAGYPYPDVQGKLSGQVTLMR
jgi:gliding motility-associated-like protein